jgi:hypothetical protein
MSLSIGGLFLQLNRGGVVFNGVRQTTSQTDNQPSSAPAWPALRG